MLQLARKPVEPCRRAALLVVQARLVEGQGGEAADRVGELDVLGAESPRLAIVEHLDKTDHAVADPQRHAELRAVAVAPEELRLDLAQARIVGRVDDHRPTGGDRQGAGGELVKREGATDIHVLVGLSVLVADQQPQGAAVGVHLVDVAGVHVEGVKKAHDDRLQDLVHVEALGEVETGVTHQLEVAPARPRVEHQADVLDRHADVLGRALDEVHLLVAELAARPGTVEDDDPDVAVGGLHWDEQHALEAHVRREQGEARLAGTDVANDGLSGIEGLVDERELAALAVDLMHVDAEAEAGAPLPRAALDHEQDARRRLHLFPHPFDGVLEEVLEIGARAAGAHDVGARLGQLGARARVAAERADAFEEVREEHQAAAPEELVRE